MNFWFEQGTNNRAKCLLREQLDTTGGVGVAAVSRWNFKAVIFHWWCRLWTACQRVIPSVWWGRGLFWKFPCCASLLSHAHYHNWYVLKKTKISHYPIKCKIYRKCGWYCERVKMCIFLHNKMTNKNDQKKKQVKIYHHTYFYYYCQIFYLLFSFFFKLLYVLLFLSIYSSLLPPPHK